MKIKIYLLVFLVVFSMQIYGFEIDKNYVVVHAEKLIPTEKKAVEILANHLDKILNCRIQTIAESKWDGKISAIFVGNTNYLKKHNIDLSKAESEEWYVRAMPDNNIIIAGGRPRGVLFGVYEFLEYVGCRYLSIYAKYIPRLESININNKMLINKKPFFKRRFLFLGLHSKEQAAFYSWNKMNDLAAIDISNKGLYNLRQQGHCNTFYIYGKDFPKDKPEYFSMTKDGKRLRPRGYNGPGQLCLSNPDVRCLVKKKLSEYIKADRELSVKRNWPETAQYLISINDCPGECMCPGCSKLLEKYGSYSGVLLDFINDIAKDFPNKTIVTTAYLFAAAPPKQGIKARENVLINRAFIGPEYGGQNNTMNPLNAPLNKATMKLIDSWRSFASHFAHWDYLKLFKTRSCLPYTNIPAMKANMPILADSGVIQYFAEIEYSCPLSIMAFHDMGVYLNMKLMEDPYRDSDAVIKDFMEKYYGKATGKMKEYLDYLIERQTSEKMPLGKQSFRQWKYLDIDFFNKVSSLLSDAKDAVKNDPVRLKRVCIEWVPLDFALLQKWNTLKRVSGEKFKFDRKIISKRLVENSAMVSKKYLGDGYFKRKKLKEDPIEIERKKVKKLINSSKTAVPLPSQFAQKTCIQILAKDMKGVRDAHSVKDVDAANGECIRLAGDKNNKLPFIGIWERNRKRNLVKHKIKRVDIPKDEKYHLYKLGRMKPGGNMVGWAHYSWLIRFPTNAMEADLEYDVYASLKLEGPAYVKNSTKGNAFSIDRVIYVQVK